jgi:hypothetical protein
MPTDAQLQAGFLAARNHGKILSDEVIADIMAVAQSIRPGARFQLNESSGNTGRKGFVLYASNTEPDKVVVRFDGFAYNTITDTYRLDILPDEPFREV